MGMRKGPVHVVKPRSACYNLDINANKVIDVAKRHFNTIGTCIPASDYMIDISGRVEKVKEMVDRGNYFTINRPRQYGKTTLISALTHRLSDEYICARISFEGLGDESFESAKAFCGALMDKIQNTLKNTAYGDDYADSWNNPVVTSFNLLNNHITDMCRNRKVVLLIDEVDKISSNRVFLHFLGVLREKFLQRKEGLDSTFQSVILAGVPGVDTLFDDISKNLENHEDINKFIYDVLILGNNFAIPSPILSYKVRLCSVLIKIKTE